MTHRGARLSNRRDESQRRTGPVNADPANLVEGRPRLLVDERVFLFRDDFALCRHLSI